jgi:two-component system response regulator AtoC
MAGILIAEDETHIRKALATVLSKEKYEVYEAENGQEAYELLCAESQRWALLFIDLHMPQMDGMELLRRVRDRFPHVMTIVITAYSTPEKTMEAMHLGAFDYIVKPFDISHVKQVTARAIETQRLSGNEAKKEVKSETSTSPVPLFSSPLIGRSLMMQHVYKIAGRVSSSNIPVLIQGESGTGKELIARSIHETGNRARGPLVAVNCAAIPETLLESELFGHEKGAFTGAVEKRTGRFERAQGGTLFLDEIGELPFHLQVKLLRVLQEQEIERVGGEKTIPIDVRIIAATNRDLNMMVQKGTFREDLYYRLNGVTIDIPPLRHRKEDIGELVSYFLFRYVKENGGPPLYMHPEALRSLERYDWPGNIRQLQNVVYRAAVLAANGIILPEHLPSLREEEDPVDSEANAFVLHKTFSGSFTLRDILRSAERETMKWALGQTNGNKAQAARLLDISRKAFIYKCQEYGLEE